MTIEIAGAIILFLRSKCAHVQVRQKTQCTNRLEDFTLYCPMKCLHTEDVSECFLLNNGLCPIGITKDQLRMDQIDRLLMSK